MIGPKLDVKCQMPDVDAVCSAGHSHPAQNNIDKSATTQCFDIEKFEYLDRQSGYIQFEVIARTSFHPRERAARDIFGLNQL